MCQLCPGFLLGKNRTASLSVMNQRLLLAAILAILAAGHVRRTIRCIFHRNHDLWILKRQGAALMRQSHHQLPMPLGVPTH
jgi:acid phosphatase family membrane protein YuiD